MDDPRAERSKLYLKEALLILLLNNPYEKITVGDIAKKAGVNRSTFYTNYKSKTMLLKETAQDALEKIHEALHQQRQSLGELVFNFKTVQPIFLQLFEGIYEKSSYYKTIIQSQFKHEFIEAMYKEFIDFGKKHLTYEFPIGSSVDKNVYLEYTMSSVLGVILYWIRNDFQDSPSEIAMKISVITQNPPTRVMFD